MGTIRRRGDTFNAMVRRVGFPHQTASFDTYAEAEAWVVDVESRMFKNEFRPIDKARSTGVATIFEKYRDEVSMHKKGKKWEEVRINLLLRTAEFMKRMCSDDLAEGVREWRDARLKQISSESVRREMNLISAVFGHAIKEWKIPIRGNPVKDVARPPKGKSRTRRYLPAEVEAIKTHFGFDMAVQPTTTWATVPWLVLVTLEVPMRLGEVCAIRIEDVHLDEQWLYMADTKNNHDRQVPLSKRAVELLRAMIGDRKAGRVFEVNKDTVGVYFRKACKDLGIENLHIHDTRREATTRIAPKFSNVLELAAVTGHKDLRSLAVYYAPTVTDLAKKLG